MLRHSRAEPDKSLIISTVVRRRGLSASVRRQVELLRKLGYERVLNLRGGIKAWAETVDPSMPVY